jgi:AP-1 complex subunit gamma-1
LCNNHPNVSEGEIVEILEKILNYNAGSIFTRQYAINALMKLSTRLTSVSERIQTIMSIYGCNMSLELQQRAVEYDSIFRRYDHLRGGLFESMPVMETKINENTSFNIAVNNDDEQSDFIHVQKQDEQATELIEILNELSTDDPFKAEQKVKKIQPKLHHSDIDLIGMTDILETSTTAPSSVTTQTPSKAIFDFLNSPSETNCVSIQESNMDHLDLDMNTHFSRNTSQTQSKNPKESLIAYYKNNLKIIFVLDRKEERSLHLIMNVNVNSANDVIKNFKFEASVPKTFQLELSPPKTTTITSTQPLQQTIHIKNSNHERLRMRIRVTYTLGENINNIIKDQEEISNFPESFWK